MIRLHLGCGPNNYPGWINIDKYDKRANVVADALSLSYEPGTVDEIYASHFIEHIHPDDLKSALKTWYAVLKPSGILIVRCPYAPVFLEQWIKATDEQRYDLSTGILNCVLGIQDRTIGHRNQNLFTESLLRMYMENAGFSVECCERVSTRSDELRSLLMSGQSDQPLKVQGRPLNDLYCKAIK